MSGRNLAATRDVCAEVGAEPLPASPGDRMGLSRSARTERPLHGLRIAPGPGTSGWYVWAGEWSDADDFFEPTHVGHVSESCPLVERFLSLPPGWRFLTDGDHVDVWFDPVLLESGGVDG